MKQFVPFAVGLLAVLMCSCNPDAREQGNTAANNPSKAVEGTPTVKAAVLDKDPRKIGPEKSASQRHIEDNIYKINASENPLQQSYF